MHSLRYSLACQNPQACCVLFRALARIQYQPSPAWRECFATHVARLLAAATVVPGNDVTEDEDRQRQDRDWERATPGHHTVLMPPGVGQGVSAVAESEPHQPSSPPSQDQQLEQQPNPSSHDAKAVVMTQQEARYLSRALSAFGASEQRDASSSEGGVRRQRRRQGEAGD